MACCMVVETRGFFFFTLEKTKPSSSSSWLVFRFLVLAAGVSSLFEVAVATFVPFVVAALAE